jgi:hypothetical protein
MQHCSAVLAACRILFERSFHAAFIVPSTLCVLQHTIYRGPREVARHVLAHEGGPLGLFKGLGATLGRESIGNMAMFGVYELVKQQLVELKVGVVAGCCLGGTVHY